MSMGILERLARLGRTQRGERRPASHAQLAQLVHSSHPLPQSRVVMAFTFPPTPPSACNARLASHAPRVPWALLALSARTLWRGKLAALTALRGTAASQRMLLCWLFALLARTLPQAKQIAHPAQAALAVRIRQELHKRALQASTHLRALKHALFVLRGTPVEPTWMLRQPARKAGTAQPAQLGLLRALLDTTAPRAPLRTSCESAQSGTIAQTQGAILAQLLAQPADGAWCRGQQLRASAKRALLATTATQDKLEGKPCCVLQASIVQRGTQGRREIAHKAATVQPLAGGPKLQPASCALPATGAAQARQTLTMTAQRVTIAPLVLLLPGKFRAQRVVSVGLAAQTCSPRQTATTAPGVRTAPGMGLQIPLIVQQGRITHCPALTALRTAFCVMPGGCVQTQARTS